jgi:hypothetical protein
MAKHQFPLLRNFIAARRASAAVEFALCGMAIFLFFFIVLNLGLLGFQLSILARAVQATGRWAAVHASASYVANSTSATFTLPCTSQDAGAFNSFTTSSALPLLSTTTTSVYSGTVTSGNLSLTAAWTTASINAVPGIYVTMSAVYTWQPIGFFGGITIPLKIATAATVGGSATTSGAKVATSCS